MRLLAGLTVLLACLVTPNVVGKVFGGDAPTLADAARRVRIAKIKDAALRSIDGSIAFLSERLSTADELALAMLADPDRYRTPADSTKLLRESERDRLTVAFREQLAAFAEHHAGELPPTWVDDVMSEEHARVDATVGRLLDRPFNERYAAARTHALETQRADLDADVHPGAAEIEGLAGSREALLAGRREEIVALATSQNARALTDDYARRLATGHSLFTENAASLRQRVRGAIADALVLLWRQLRLVHRARPEGLLERSEISAHIVGDLTELAAEAESLSGTRYGVFPAARAFASEQGEALEMNAFANVLRQQLDTSAGCPGLSPRLVLDAIGSSADSVPSEREFHERELREALRPETERRLLDRHVGGVESPELRSGLRLRLADSMRTDGVNAEMLDRGISSCIRSPLGRRRHELAQRELSARQPAVADLSFAFSDRALERLVSDPLDESDAGEFPAEAGLRMEETRALYQERRRHLMREARNAVWQQISLARAPERKSSFVAAIMADPDRSEHHKADWQDRYEKGVLGAWHEARDGVLLKDDNGKPLHPDKYERLFGFVSDIIDEIITLEFARPAEPAQMQAARSAGAGSQEESESAGSPTAQVVLGQPAREETATQTTATRAVAAAPVTSRAGDARHTPSPARAKAKVRPKTPAAAPKVKDSGGDAASTESPRPCDALVESCALASEICYEALTTCKSDPTSCDAGIARCDAEISTCELNR